MLNKPDIFISCESGYKKAGYVLFGAPFDGTTTYRPGARFAAKRMREESYGIETYSPYLNKDLADISVFDAGDLNLPIGSTQNCLNAIEQFCDTVYADKKLPVMAGGEHLVTLPAVKAAAKKYKDLTVIQFDAHADLRDDYLGEKLSHSTVMRRISKITGGKNVYQFGIRSGEKAEFDFAAANTNMTKFTMYGIEDAILKIKNRPVYLTVDMDVIDPSEFPATGTPEAGGIGFLTLIKAVEKIGKLNIVGCDMTELSPPYDASGASTALACKFLRELLLSVAK